MKCEECLQLLDDYIEGELDETKSNRVTAHVTVCAVCQAEYEMAERERAAYASYRRQVRIPSDLWRKVERRLEIVKRERERRMFGGVRDWLTAFVFTPRLTFTHAVAMIIIAVGVTAGAFQYGREKTGQVAERNDERNFPESKPSLPGANTTPKITEVEPLGAEAPKSNIVKPPRAFLVSAPTRKMPRTSNASVQSTAELIREAETKYIVAINRLLRDTQGKRMRLDVATQIKFNGALADIDSVIAETRKAVRRNPKDPIAAQYMLSAYGKKVDVLQEIAQSKSE